MALISELKNKKILVLGIGEEGIDNLLFLKERCGCKEIGVADKRRYEDLKEEVRDILSGTNHHFGEDYLSSLEHYDVIIKSPGIPLSKIEKKEGQTVTSQTDIFLKNCKGKIIGVTGTKGKSTICSLLQKVFENEGLKSYLIGNIGKPALSFLGKEKEGDVFIYEMSSFQLATATLSPHIAVILNIYADHLDNHENFEEYVGAKRNITRYQIKEDTLIFNALDSNVCQIAEKSKARKVPFYPNNNLERKDISTPLEPVYVIAKEMVVSEKSVKDAVVDFKTLPHRVEFVGEFNGVRFYNDSAATIPEATIKALNILKDADTLIAGGVDKCGNYRVLAEKIAESDVKNIVLFKESGEKIEKELKNRCSRSLNLFYAKDMREAVDISFQVTKNICLLSPASSSFNMFKDYKERGELYKKYVREYEEKRS